LETIEKLAFTAVFKSGISLNGLYPRCACHTVCIDSRTL